MGTKHLQEALQMQRECDVTCHKIRNIALEKVCNRGMIFKDTQCHYNYCYQVGRIRVSLPVSGL